MSIQLLTEAQRKAKPLSVVHPLPLVCIWTFITAYLILPLGWWWSGTLLGLYTHSHGDSRGHLAEHMGSPRTRSRKYVIFVNQSTKKKKDTVYSAQKLNSSHNEESCILIIDSPPPPHPPQKYDSLWLKKRRVEWLQICSGSHLRLVCLNCLWRAVFLWHIWVLEMILGSISALE